MHWVCKVCGYVHDEDEPPVMCPVCGAPLSKFSEINDNDPDFPYDETVNDDDVDPFDKDLFGEYDE